MIDKNLYRETFSQLHASEEAKQEVFQMMQEIKHRKRLPRVLRGAAIAAAMTMALAVTAGAVNVATDGEFAHSIHLAVLTWTGQDSVTAVDEQGNEVYITVADGELVTKENGRLILHAQGEEIDITEAMETEGAYHYAYDMEVVCGDGSRETRTVTIDVTGDLDQWTVTQDNGDGTGSKTVSGSDGLKEFSGTMTGQAAEDFAADLPAAGESSVAVAKAREAAPEA